MYSVFNFCDFDASQIQGSCLQRLTISFIDSVCTCSLLTELAIVLYKTSLGKMSYFNFRVKSLTSQLSEKEAMLRVYQRSPMTRSSSVHTIYCTPHHSPRPSLIATGSLSRQGSQDASLFIKHKKTASSSALETSSKLSQDDLFQKIQSLQAEVYKFSISLRKHAHAIHRDFLSFKN